MTPQAQKGPSSATEDFLSVRVRTKQTKPREGYIEALESRLQTVRSMFLVLAGFSIGPVLWAVGKQDYLATFVFVLGFLVFLFGVGVARK